jgi:uncharacterized protein YdeI (YjbR/CyaY-like superfamily)
MKAYSKLTQSQKDNIVTFIQSCTSSEGAKERITDVVAGLKKGITNFS